jgi:hypothetical protein
MKDSYYCSYSFQNETGMVVNVIESATPSLLPVVMAFGHTSFCNLLTDSNLYCLYPELIHRGENLRINTDQEFSCNTVLVPFNYGLRTYSSASQWRFIGRTCGIHCVAVWRDSGKLTGAAIIPFQSPLPAIVREGDGGDPMLRISSSRIRWSIGKGLCENHLCPYVGRGKRC